MTTTKRSLSLAKSGILAAALLSLPALAVTQESPLPRMGSSKPGEVQTGRRQDPNAAGKSPMPAAPRSQAGLAMTGPGTMESQGRAQPAPAPGKVAMPIDTMATRDAGPQVGRRTALAASASQTHVHLVLEISKGAGATVVDARELPGEAPIVDSPRGDFVLELASGTQTVAAQGIHDPFEAHSFGGDAPNEFREHHFEQMPKALVSLQVPKANLNAVSVQDLAVRLYRIKPGDMVAKIDPEAVSKLRQANRLELRTDTVEMKIGPEVVRQLQLHKSR